MVRVIGLEPTRPKAPEPKSGASTNFATPACSVLITAKKKIINKKYKANYLTIEWLISSGISFRTKNRHVYTF